MSATTVVAARRTVLPAAVIALGTLALATREVGAAALWVTLSVGIAGGLLSTDARHPGTLRWVACVALGVAGFVAVRVWFAWPVPPFVPWALAATAGAAVAEEAFFRGLVYGWLARWGAAVAIGGAALAFAVVHVPMYGAAALPLNVAAGLVLGWQRWATGSWTAPAAAHVIANLLMV